MHDTAPERSESSVSPATRGVVGPPCRDIGDGPWAWQEKNMLRLIRDRFAEVNGAAAALVVYLALTELASDEQAETFIATKAKIASRAGLSYRKTADTLKALEAIGVVYIEAQKAAKAHNAQIKAPNRYTLTTIGTACLTTIGTDGKQDSFADMDEESPEDSPEKSPKKPTALRSAQCAAQNHDCAERNARSCRKQISEETLEEYGSMRCFVEIFNERAEGLGLWPVNKFTAKLLRIIEEFVDTVDADDAEQALRDLLADDERIDKEKTFFAFLRNRGYTPSSWDR